MTTSSSKMLIAAVTTATLAMGATTANADHYVRSCGTSYVSYAPTYYTPTYYAPAPVVYPAPAYGYVPYRPVAYARPVYYPAPRYYAPAPIYRTRYAPSSHGFGFGYSSGGHGRHYSGGFAYSRGGHYGGHRGGHHGGGFSFRVGR